MTATVTYQVCPVDPGAHRFQVACQVDAAAQQVLRMASWIPGSYLLREYARHVVSLKASDARGAVAVTKLDKSRWQCANQAGPLTVTLTVYAFDLSVRGAYLDQRRAFFNGPCLFPEFLGISPGPLDVTIQRPPSGMGPEWRVATAMGQISVDESGFGHYRAEDYEEVLDHPVEISDFVTIDFKAAGVPHHFALSGRQDADLERLAADLRQICETQIALFGAPPPMQRYWFLGMAVGPGEAYGGLEHRASSSLMFSRDDLPRPVERGVSKSYKRFLGLVSHEYFHSWNVKRIKPAAFIPYRFDQRNHTRLLWVFEGMTSYYQDLLVLRSELLSVTGYLERLAQTLTRVYRVPGRSHQSLAEASFEAWDQLYKPTENNSNVSVSYYTKGALVALALDLTLRRDTDGQVSLDHVVRGLWLRHGLTGIGVEEDGFESLVQELSGLDLTAFFDASVRGTEDLDLANLLRAFAIAFQLRPRLGPQDEGGVLVAPQFPGVTLGAEFSRKDPGLLARVLTGGPAQQAGLAPGDQLVALDDFKVTAENLATRLSHYEPGEDVGVLAFRGDELISVSLTFQVPPMDTVALSMAEEPDAAALARRVAWLGE